MLSFLIPLYFLPFSCLYFLPHFFARFLISSFHFPFIFLSFFFIISPTGFYHIPFPFWLPPLSLVSLSPQKELAKPSLSPSFLSSPFTSTSSPLPPSISLPPASISSSPLLSHTSSPLTPAISLHPRPPSSSSLFTASFLRPAPGPIRTNQGSILFTPYWCPRERRGVQTHNLWPLARDVLELQLLLQLAYLTESSCRDMKSMETSCFFYQRPSGSIQHLQTRRKGSAVAFTDPLMSTWTQPGASKAPRCIGKQEKCAVMKYSWRSIQHLESNKC